MSSQAAGKNRDPLSQINQGAARAASMMQRSLSPWVQRALAAGGPSAPLNMGGAGRVAQRAAALYERVQRSAERTAAWDPSPVTAQVYRMEAFSGGVVQRFPDVGAKYQRQPLESAGNAGSLAAPAAPVMPDESGLPAETGSVPSPELPQPQTIGTDLGATTVQSIRERIQRALAGRAGSEGAPAIPVFGASAGERGPSAPQPPSQPERVRPPQREGQRLRRYTHIEEVTHGTLERPGPGPGPIAAGSAPASVAPGGDTSSLRRVSEDARAMPPAASASRVQSETAASPSIQRKSDDRAEFRKLPAAVPHPKLGGPQSASSEGEPATYTVPDADQPTGSVAPDGTGSIRREVDDSFPLRGYVTPPRTEAGSQHVSATGTDTDIAGQEAAGPTPAAPAESSSGRKRVVQRKETSESSTSLSAKSEGQAARPAVSRAPVAPAPVHIQREPDSAEPDQSPTDASPAEDESGASFTSSEEPDTTDQTTDTTDSTPDVLPEPSPLTGDESEGIQRKMAGPAPAIQRSEEHIAESPREVDSVESAPEPARGVGLVRGSALDDLPLQRKTEPTLPLRVTKPPSDKGAAVPTGSAVEPPEAPGSSQPANEAIHRSTVPTVHRMAVDDGPRGSAAPGEVAAVDTNAAAATLSGLAESGPRAANVQRAPADKSVESMSDTGEQSAAREAPVELSGPVIQRAMEATGAPENESASDRQPIGPETADADELRAGDREAPAVRRQIDQAMPLRKVAPAIEAPIASQVEGESFRAIPDAGAQSIEAPAPRADGSVVRRSIDSDLGNTAVETSQGTESASTPEPPFRKLPKPVVHVQRSASAGAAGNVAGHDVDSPHPAPKDEMPLAAVARSSEPPAVMRALSEDMPLRGPTVTSGSDEAPMGQPAAASAGGDGDSETPQAHTTASSQSSTVGESGQSAAQSLRVARVPSAPGVIRRAAVPDASLPHTESPRPAARRGGEPPNDVGKPPGALSGPSDESFSTASPGIRRQFQAQPGAPQPAATFDETAKSVPQARPGMPVIQRQLAPVGRLTDSRGTSGLTPDMPLPRTFAQSSFVRHPGSLPDVQREQILRAPEGPFPSESAMPTYTERPAIRPEPARPDMPLRRSIASTASSAAFTPAPKTVTFISPLAAAEGQIQRKGDDSGKPKDSDDKGKKDSGKDGDTKKSDATDLDALAQQILPLIKRMLAIERERLPRL